MKKCIYLTLMLAFTGLTMLSSANGKVVQAGPKKDSLKTGYRNDDEPKTLKFAGYTWKIRSKRGGPGPNNWSEKNAFVDKNGFLHLKLTQDTLTHTWDCSEVIMTEKLGYGTYQWKIDGRIDTLDHNIVFGLFNYSGEDLHDEMDIEFSKWGHPENDKNLNYTIWPASGVTVPKNVEYAQPFSLSGTYTTHRFKRTEKALTFTSLNGFQDGDKNIFATKTWEAPKTSISQLEMPVFINLWLFKGKAPVNNKDVEIVIRDFKFIPL